MPICYQKELHKRHGTVTTRNASIATGKPKSQRTIWSRDCSTPLFHLTGTSQRFVTTNPLQSWCIWYGCCSSMQCVQLHNYARPMNNVTFQETNFLRSDFLSKSQQHKISVINVFLHKSQIFLLAVEQARHLISFRTFPVSNAQIACTKHTAACTT